MNKTVVSTLVALMVGSWATASSAYVPSTLRVGFTPWENPQDMAKTAAPMVQLLAKATGMKVESFLASDYAGVIQAMRVGKVDVAFFPPGAYVKAESYANARVILKSQINGKAVYYSAIFTRKDSGISSLKDLKGRSFAFVDPTSTSGSIYPRVMLMNAGINPDRDFRQVLNAGGHDAVVLSVLRGKVDAGAAYSNDPAGVKSAFNEMVKDPKDRAKFKVLAVSKPIPADDMAVKADLDPKIVNAIRRAFLDLSATPAGRARIRQLYDVDAFVPAQPSDYDSVREAFSKIGLPIK